jgi:nucleoside-diphosphate-sugar epimerase
MKILVTGGSGFLGSTLAYALAEAGHQLIVPLRQRSQSAIFSHSAIQQTPIRSLENMTKAEWLPLLAGVNAVIHAAAIAHIGVAVPENQYQRVNATASGVLAEAAKLAGVADFIFVSSIRAQVGATSAVIQTEATPPEPSEPYGCSKLQAERLIAAVFPDATVFRPALIVGGKPKANLASLVRLADTPFPLPFGGLSAPQAMVSLEHFIDAIKLALQTPSMRGETYVVADDPHPSLADMLTFLREGMGRPRRLIPVPTALLTVPLKLLGKANITERLMGGLQVDAGKLRSAGWQPKGSPSETLRALGRSA